MVVPTHPTPHLVVAQADLSLSLTEEFFDPVSHPVDPCEHCATLMPVVAQGVPGLGLFLARPHYHQPFLRADTTIVVLRLHHRQQHFYRSWTFLSVPYLHLSPPARWLPRHPLIHPLELGQPQSASLLGRRASLGWVTHLGVTGDVQHIAETPQTQRGTQLTAATELVVAHDPTSRHVGAGVVQQLQPQAPLLGEGHLGGDVSLFPAAAVCHPVLGQVETGVEQGLAVGTGIGEEDADLTVIDFAEPTAPLPVHTAGILSFLGEGGPVENEDALGMPQLLG